MTLDAELSQSQDERLQEVLAGYLRDVEAGRNPDQQEILARHPELAGELQDFFAGQEKFGRLAAPLRQAIEPIPDVGIPGTLGDFRILRQVGKGGMGVVYEAEQISLRRRVALKVLPFAATMDPRHLQRFHNEAQAAACLHHTNIVPVFFVGCERGVHFYAMQFIDGQPLSEVIRQMQRLEKKAQPKKGEKTVAYQPSAEEAVSTPLPAAELTPLSGEGPRGRDYYRKVAELGIQAAEALDHAHQLGIVHRDIKPGNLLLDGMGRVWVTDFGLAHIQHSEASLTATGQALGTPRYMSPEQALAKRVPIDHRTDVYSLGVTLYELLTLRPAFASEDRHELLRQIAFEEPSRPRRLDRSIPAELEIIVLKAMEKRPQERYATAQEMADDLERWLKYEPIRARRPTMLQHASKWMRRHRRAVAASAALFLMALMLAGYITWTRHDQTLRRLAIERAILAASKESNYWQEQRRLPEALSAARRGDGLLAGADVDEDLRQRVHKRLADLELLDRLENIRLEKLFPDKGRDHSRDEDEVDRLYAKTFGDAGLDVENLPVEEMGEHLRNSTVAVELAAVIDDWALVCQGIRGADDPSWKALLRVARLADPDALRTRVRESLERQDRQALQAVTSSADVFQLSPVTLSLLDAAYRSEEARGKREAFLREAQRRHPNDFWLNNHLINFYLKCVPPRWEEALPFLTVAVALRPDSAAAHHNLGIALVDKGHLDEGIAESREAIHLKKDYPEAYHSLGYALHRKGHLDEAISEYREALRIKKDYAEVYSVLGLALKDKGRLDEAIAACREAIRIDKDLPEAHCNLGNALFDKGLLDEAIAEYRAALRSKKFFLEAYNAHNGLANALAVTGRLDEAMAEVHKALRLKKDFPEAHSSLGNILKAKGRLDEAIAAYREAIRIKKDDAGAHCNLGNALKDKGRLEEAIAAYREAIRINKNIPAAYCNLGDALRQRGLFRQAAEAMRRGHELGSKKPYWPYPSAQWVQNYQRLADLDGKLPAILSGQKQPADTAERLALAQFCQLPSKQLNLAAARFYSAAFVDQPELADDLNAQHRYNAACAAALAGCGQGKDVDKLDVKERARLRQQALDWLRADLKAYRQLMEKSADKAGPVIAQRMQQWLKDNDFARVRGDKALAKLPEAERAAWRKLWADVAELLAKAQGKAPAEKKPDTK